MTVNADMPVTRRRQAKNLNRESWEREGTGQVQLHKTTNL